LTAEGRFFVENEHDGLLFEDLVWLALGLAGVDYVAFAATGHR
jgi:hypothetical protein